MARLWNGGRGGPRGTWPPKDNDALSIAAFPHKASVARPRPHPSSRLAPHSQEAFTGPTSHPTYRWRKGIQTFVARGHSWQRGAQEEAGPHQWQADMGEASLHKALHARFAEWQEYSRQSGHPGDWLILGTPPCLLEPLCPSRGFVRLEAQNPCGPVDTLA